MENSLWKRLQTCRKTDYRINEYGDLDTYIFLHSFHMHIFRCKLINLTDFVELYSRMCRVPDSKIQWALMFYVHLLSS
jgi:hypothetical protein